MSTFLKNSIRLCTDPRLDQRLASDAKPGCFGIHDENHPSREINVDPLNWLSRATFSVRIEVVKNINFVVIEQLVEFSH